MPHSPVSLRGVFPPIPTPFDAVGDVSHAALADNLKRWNRYDLAGYVVLGSNGELPYLTQTERIHVLRKARGLIPPDKLLIAGTGCESTRETITLTRKAAEEGADAALVLTPHYYGGRMTADSLVSHYHAVADAAPIPIIVYNVPKFTHLDLDVPTIVQAARHPNVVGIKDSSGNITKLGDVVRQTAPDFQVLAGTAGFFFAGLALGAVGGILALANVAPQESIDIYRLFQERKWDEAAQLQRRMIPVNAAVTSHFGIPGLKAALDMLGYYGGPVRSPLQSLSNAEGEVVQTVLEEGDLL